MLSISLNKKTRNEIAVGQKENLEKELKEYFPNSEIEYFYFSNQLYRGNPDAAPKGKQTRLDVALEELNKTLGDESETDQIIFLLSDGENTQPVEDNLEALLEKYREKRNTIFSIPPNGSYLPPLTANIGQLSTPSIAECNQPIEISFNLNTRLYSPQNFSVLITRNNEKHHLKKITMQRSGSNRQRFNVQLNNSGYNYFAIHILPEDPRLMKLTATFVIKGILADTQDIEEDPLTVSKSIITPGETVILHLSDPHQKLKILLPSRTDYTNLPKMENQILKLPLLSPGQYEIAAFHGEDEITSKQIINVLPHSLEKEFSGINRPFLELISSKTNGMVLDNESRWQTFWNQVKRDSSEKPKVQESSKSLLNLELLILTILILLYLWTSPFFGKLK
jgi:hypothetical protein